MFNSLRMVGRRLAGALSGIATNSEVKAVDNALVEAARKAHAEKLADPVYPPGYVPSLGNRKEQRKRKALARIRPTKATRFHVQRDNPHAANGIHQKFLSVSLEEAYNRGLHILRNPLALSIVKATTLARRDAVPSTFAAPYGGTVTGRASSLPTAQNPNT